MNWVAVADHDVSTLKDAGKILCRQKMRVTGFNTFRALEDFLGENRPDLILLGRFPDEPGGLDTLLSLFTEAGVNIEYMYAFIGGKDVKHAYMIFRVADTKAAEIRLASKGLKILTQDDIAQI